VNPRDLIADNDHGETLAEGGTWLLDLVAAVDHLRRGIRPGITVWDAFEEALRWLTPAGDDGEPAWDDPDPLRRTLSRFLDRYEGAAAAGMQVAVRRWAQATAGRYNDGHHWPHPTPRRSFPPPRFTVVDEPPDGTLSERRLLGGVTAGVPVGAGHASLEKRR